MWVDEGPGRAIKKPTVSIERLSRQVFGKGRRSSRDGWLDGRRIVGQGRVQAKTFGNVRHAFRAKTVPWLLSPHLPPVVSQGFETISDFSIFATLGNRR